MTTEEKAKAYDEAIKRIQSYVVDEYGCTRIKVVNVFPKLTESEDERIRKELIFYFQEEIPQCSIQEHADKMKEFIAWLEKQGEITKEWSEMKINNIHTELREMVDLKQKTEYGEQKPTDKVEPKFKVGDFIVGDYCFGKVIALTDDAYLLDTGQGIPFSCEHNAHLWTIQDAKDGDVLINDFHLIFIFKEIKNNMYISHCSIIDRGNNDVIVNSIIDREVGDVNLVKCQPATKEQRDALMKAMADAGYTFDFEKKELKKIEQKPAYTKEYDFHGITFIPKFAKGDIIKDKKCGEVSTIEDFSYDTGLYTHTYGQFPITIQDNYEIIAQKPAWSEEDRQTLRLIIDDLSEELNDEPDEADKEILCRKISFLNSLKPQPIHKWDREDNKIKVEITNYLECQKREEPTRKDILNKWISWIASLNPQCKQCSTTWSGEDERRRKRIVERLENIRKSKEDNVDVASVILSEIEWLKSLKDRVQPQPKPVEWSDKNKEMAAGILNYLCFSTDATDLEGFDEWYDWLKSITKEGVLPQQKKKEWSEEDERVRIALFLLVEAYGAHVNYEVTQEEMLSWLKSLRPQKQWKPSEEMLKALYRAIPENTMAISEDEMLLDKLYQGLKYGRVLSNK